MTNKAFTVDSIVYIYVLFTPFKFKTMNVLIVEDEKSLAKEMTSFLKNEGYICDVAHTGKEASEKVFVNPYDFLLLDLGLPDYDGLDLLKEAKEANQEAAVIILTARGSTGDKVKGLDLGADDYLAKPFSLLELSSRMQAIIRRKHGLKKAPPRFTTL